MCSASGSVSKFLFGTFVMPQESKLMTAAVTQKTTQRFAVQCCNANSHVDSTAVKQSVNAWSYDTIGNSMLTDFSVSDEKNELMVEKLKLQVIYMLRNTIGLAEQLQLIDVLQRLGVAYHFGTEIKIILDRIHFRNYKNGDINLHTAALTFRLLRQNGYFVTQDIFSSFIDNDTGLFKLSIREDIEGMLSLYEASYLLIEGEKIMEEGMKFTSAYLHNLKNSDKLSVDDYLYLLLTHALERPLHWSIERLEARWFIEEAYPRKHDMNSCLLQLAKLDFNSVQGMYRDELQDLSRWWDKLGLAKAMDFVRDSLVISYVWSASIYWEPKYKNSRKVFAQAVALLTIFDDVYDVNGALDELELLTTSIERWDVEAMETLPHHLKMCNEALDDFINEVARLSFSKNGFNSYPTLKNAWTTLLRSFLNESRWYHSGYQPTLEEYMSNSRVSVGVYSVTMHAYLFDPISVSETELKYLESDPEISKCAAVIFRACNDLGTAQEELKGDTDTPKSVQCYMHETKASKEAAEEHVRDMVTKGWKELNKHRHTEMRMSLRTTDKFLDTARAGLCIYQYTNRNGMEDSVTEDIISKILHSPVYV